MNDNLQSYTRSRCTKEDMGLFVERYTHLFVLYSSYSYIRTGSKVNTYRNETAAPSPRSLCWSIESERLIFDGTT